ncbi:MAG TPA: phosphate signaling complex protein PhoU [Parasulfuritortus sp.]
MDMRHILESKKGQIETNLDGLFEDVMGAIGRAVKCLVKLDESVCQSLIRFEASLHEKRRLLEHDCLVAIASQQPVAGDLRDIVADMRIASELARMGDYASDIAASIMEMDATPIEKLGLLDIQVMAGHCEEMVHNAMRAHNTDSVELARRVIDSDVELDVLLKKMIVALMEAMRADPANVHNGSRMLWIAHNLERYGDRACNIAEQVIFRVEG